MQVLVNHRTEATLALLMRLCTQADSSQEDADYIAEVSEFAALYSYKCALRPGAVLHRLCSLLLNMPAAGSACQAHRAELCWQA